MEIARYLARGYTSFILDIPVDAEDLETAAIVFRMAQDHIDTPVALRAT